MRAGEEVRWLGGERAGEEVRLGGEEVISGEKSKFEVYSASSFFSLSNWVAAAVVLSAMIPSVAVLTILLLPA